MGISKLEHYPKRINMKLENAYKDGNTPKVTLNAVDGDLIVDLQTMKEYPVSDPTDQSDVVRRELMKGKSTIQLFIHCHHLHQLTLNENEFK